MMSANELGGVTETLEVRGERSTIYCLDRIPEVDAKRLLTRPLTTRILLENMIRHFDPKGMDLGLIRSLANGKGSASDHELPFYPGRVLLQDFTGVPVIVDLTALRSAAAGRGLDPLLVNPRIPVDLIVDHSVQVDSFGTKGSLLINLDREYDRNSERYALFRWAQDAYQNYRVVPPGNGICHQVNLEYLASVVDRRTENGTTNAFPDTLVGADSHTTMVNGLGVLGWGVGGIEAEAVLLGEPAFVPFPQVVGVRMTGQLPEGATATDLVLTVTRELRKKGVVERFVEFTGPGLAALSVPDRATISNMCPEYGATAALFPIDDATIAYLRGTGRPAAIVDRVAAYAKRQGLWFDPSNPEPEFDDHISIDLGSIVPTLSGPKNPEEAIALSDLPKAFRVGLEQYRSKRPRPARGPGPTPEYPSDDPLHPFDGNVDRASGVGGPLPSRPDPGVQDGSTVIAAITSCTNTSNPTVMMGAGLIARRARQLGLHPPAHVKTSMAPGSKVVAEYLTRAGLLPDLEAIGFDIVGYGCTTCIGNSGPLIPAVEKAVLEEDAYVAAVLSGNRNFEARIQNLVRANFLASPMLVVAFALAGRMDIDLTREPLGQSPDGHPVYLRDLWPKAEEIRQLVEAHLDPSIFQEKYRTISQGDQHWEALQVPGGTIYPWDPASTYVQNPPYFALPEPPFQGRPLLTGARALAILGDRVSTDHISPAGEIPQTSPAGAYLEQHGVPMREFNTYGARRGNHEVMVRGTFANVRLINLLAAPKEGGWTVHFPSGEGMTIFEAAERYRKDQVPLIVMAGSGYGQGSSRDWAAKGPRLLGVQAVIAKDYERIHRGNLVGMGVLPLQFHAGEGATELGLTGRERYTLALTEGEILTARTELEVTAEPDDGPARRFRVRCRIDSEVELAYYRAGGILPYVLGRVRKR
ncbi:MAG: aconitate hydratase AcnA [Thermoplasmata archaeon]